jgi:hypothetical protein
MAVGNASAEPAASGGGDHLTRPRISFNENRMPQFSGGIEDQADKTIEIGKTTADHTNKKSVLVPLNWQLAHFATMLGAIATCSSA